jgi:hypothetical protein
MDIGDTEIQDVAVPIGIPIVYKCKAERKLGKWASEFIDWSASEDDGNDGNFRETYCFDRGRSIGGIEN